ncbi:hypothetical protein GCM10009425_01540 [Pseudomonas asuensis]|uniref:Uncharacterized protein n=1 Tax=Pseudomonas asuensis TaxID=1825787 RepID=A0ABQ2GFQ6_9PSED|nr:hypothetical protein GCM10009425_01540 [Pseudomonas asuensis]
MSLDKMHWHSELEEAIGSSSWLNNALDLLEGASLSDAYMTGELSLKLSGAGVEVC